jgi:hypothetical protein
MPAEHLRCYLRALRQQPSQSLLKSHDTKLHYTTLSQAAEALWGARETVFELFESIAKSPFAPLAAELELLPLARQVVG